MLMLMVSHDERSHVAHFFDHLDLRNSVTSFIMSSAIGIGITWSKNVMLHFISIVLASGIQWYHWWCHQYHMMPMLTLIGVTWPKSYIAPHFSCLDLRSTVVVLTMLWHDRKPMSVPVVSHMYKHTHTYINIDILIDRETESFFRSPGRKSWSCLYDNFTQKMFLKRLSISNTREYSRRQMSSSWYGSFAQKVVLKRQFIIDT